MSNNKNSKPEEVQSIDINETIKEVEQTPDVHKLGNAKLYCSIDAINTGNDNKIDHILFGKMVLDDTIRNHFLAINNPYTD